jgi:hypothetical protein
MRGRFYHDGDRFVPWRPDCGWGRASVKLDGKMLRLDLAAFVALLAVGPCFQVDNDSSHLNQSGIELDWIMQEIAH